MKIYVKAATEKHNAKSACNLVIKYLEDLGFKQVYWWARATGKRGLSGGNIEMTYRFNPYTDEDLANEPKLRYIQPEYIQPEREIASYSNFELLQKLYGDVGEEDSYNPVNHTGGGYSRLDNALISDIRDFLKDSGYSDAIVKRSVSGLQGIEENLEIIILVPVN